MDKSAISTDQRWGLPPALNLHQLFGQLELPKLDVNKIAESRRKDIDAMVDAHREAYQAMQALSQRQQELLAAALKSWQNGAQAVMEAPSLSEKANQSAEQAKQAISRALTDLRELAEVATSSNRKVLAVLNHRMQEGLAEAGVSLSHAYQARLDVEPVPDDAEAAVTPSGRKGRTRTN